MFRGLMLITLLGFVSFAYVYYRIVEQGDSAVFISAKYEK